MYAHNFRSTALIYIILFHGFAIVGTRSVFEKISSVKIFSTLRRVRLQASWKFRKQLRK